MEKRMIEQRYIGLAQVRHTGMSAAIHVTRAARGLPGLCSVTMSLPLLVVDPPPDDVQEDVNEPELPAAGH